MMAVDCIFASDGKRDMDFRTGERLGKKDHIASWQKPQRPEWMSPDVYDQMPNSIQVRECTVTIDRPGFRSTSITLVTSLLDNHYASKEELGWLYSQRWAAELNLAAVKTVLKMEHLRSKTPEMVRKDAKFHSSGSTQFQMFHILHVLPSSRIQHTCRWQPPQQLGRQTLYQTMTALLAHPTHH